MIPLSSQIPVTEIANQTIHLIDWTVLFNQLLAYLTQENITFIMAFIGFIGTTLGSLRTYLAGRKKISINILDYTKYGHVNQFFMYIQNDSSNPLCISSICLNLGDVSTTCELLQKKITEKSGILYRTPLFPLNLPAHVGTAYFFEFLKCPDVELVPGKTVSFEFHTNRGVIKNL